MDINTGSNVSSLTISFIILVLFLINVTIIAPTIEDRFAASVSSQSKNVEQKIDGVSFPFLSRTHSKLSSLLLHDVDSDGCAGRNETGSKQSRLLLDVEKSESNLTSNELLSTSSTNSNTNITNKPGSESQANNSSSSYPSMDPSLAPSVAIENKDTYSPTSTTECRDNATYVSPINDQNLTCQSHINTDCLQWRHLGLTKFQLQQLLESCPQTCQFDCDAVRTFVAFDDLSVNIQIKNVDGFMDGTIKKHFEEASQRYFQEYFFERATFINFDVDALFELDQVELISQAFVDVSNVVIDESNQLRRHDTESPGDQRPSPHHGRRTKHYHEHTNLRRRQLQSLSAGQPAGTSETVKNEGLLDVVLRLDGFAMGLSSQEISDIILLKMKDEKYLKKLKQYDEYFAAAEIVSGGESSVSDSNDSSRDPSRSEPTRATLIVSYLVPLSIFAFFFGSAIYYHRSIDPKESQMETQIGGEAVFDGVDSDGHRLFASSENTVRPKDAPARIESEPKVNRASVNVLGHGLTNSSRRSEENTKSTDRDDENTALDSGSFLRSGGRENMPMIVYNIDENTGRIHDAYERLGAKATTKSTSKDTVFLQSPHHTQGNGDNSHSSTKGFSTSQREHVGNHTSSSSLSTDSRLGVPGPCNDEDSTVVSQNSVPLTISSFDYGGTSNSTRIDFDRKDLSALSQRGHARAGSSVSLPDRRLFSADKSTRKSSDIHCSMPNTISLHSQTVNVVNRSHRPPMGPPHPKSTHVRQVYRTRSPAPTKDRTHKRSAALLSLRPITKAMKESTDSFKKSWISRVGSEGSGHSRNPSLSSATSDCDNIRLDSIVPLDIEGQRYDIEAPRRGQLGIIVKGSLRNGPTVYAVKDYSPLFGEIHVGDRIIEIEGVDTTQSSLIEILKLLKAKKSSSFIKGGGSGHGGNMHIIVSRQSNNKMARQDADTYPSEISHKRDCSNGSDISISKIRNHDDDDVIDPGAEYNGYVLL